jgi:hypothetical protein
MMMHLGFLIGAARRALLVWQLSIINFGYEFGVAINSENGTMHLKRRLLRLICTNDQTW